ncbi:hypothetical protein [Amycolatopsis sp. NPDC021455]|uniref:hypothetical protein n=1 Tax=Amycolatopsis sp. NPDC021455 TaxID=3154901 RepID=UPI0033F04D44
MAPQPNTPVLVGSVQLLHVQSITVNEGYRIERIMGSRFVQATQPTNQTIAIEAVLLGDGRLDQKKELENVALTSRQLVANAPAGQGAVGISVVSGMTTNLNMQVTDLRFTQSVGKRDALDVSITLEQVLPGSPAATPGDATDTRLAPGSAALPSTPAPNPVPRTAGEPLPAGVLT